jgi:hypothetical protein
MLPYEPPVKVFHQHIQLIRLPTAIDNNNQGQQQPRTTTAATIDNNFRQQLPPETTTKSPHQQLSASTSIYLSLPPPLSNSL